MIVWLASYPRSGNTFARLVLQQMYGVRLPTAYEQNAKTDSPQPAPKPAMFPELRSNITLEEARATSEVMFVKTHEFPPDDAPAIYLVRDGRDALVSHAHYVLEFDLHLDSSDRKHLQATLRKLIETDVWFGGWGNNVLAWTSRSAPTAIVRFEELIAAPVVCTRAAIAKLGLQLAECRGYAIPEFSELHCRAPNFFRRGGVDGWRDEMPDELHELFWRRYGAAMTALGYKRSSSPFASTGPITSAA